MSDLQQYFKHELAALYEGAKRFAKQHPDTAKQLQVDGHGCHDPHVLRLLEGTAYLNARLHKKLDDDYSEFTTALLQVLYPHYLAPIPSSAIVHFKPSKDLALAYQIPRYTQLETDPQQGPVCKFRTAYTTVVWPIHVAAVKLQAHLLSAPSLLEQLSATQVLQITLRTNNEKINFNDLAITTLRFYLNGVIADMHQLYERLLCDVSAIAVGMNRHHSEEVTWLPQDSLQPVGFSEQETLLPQTDRILSSSRLLTEFFVLPEKFLFFDLNHLSDLTYKPDTTELNIYIYLKRPITQLSKPLQLGNLQLGCTPVINLFTQQAEPIQLDYTQAEFNVVADARRPDIQVHSIENVTANSVYGSKIPYQPYYGITHNNNQIIGGFWQSHWRDEDEGNGQRLTLSISENQTLETYADWTLALKTTASNGTLPQELYFQNKPWRLHAGTELISEIKWFTPPTNYHIHTSQDRNWELISHLSLNYLTLTDNGKALQELLALYDVADSASNQLQIAGIVGVKVQHTARRVMVEGLSAVCQGLQIQIDIQESYYPGQSAYLFGSVLLHILSRYASINSFTQLIITSQHFTKELYRWEPRTGTGKIL